jgi:hypothetical protein
MAQVVNVWPVGFWNIWCPSAVEVVVGRDGCAVEPVEVVGEGFGYAVEMVVVEVVGEGFSYADELRALAGEDVQVVLHFCEPRSLPVDGLPASFGALHCNLPSQYRLLFLPEPFDFLLKSC